MRSFRIFSILTLALLLAACGDEVREQRNTGRPSGKGGEIPIKFDITNNGQVFYGDSLKISVTSLIEGKTVDFVKISMPDEKLTLIEGQRNSFTISTADIGGGEIRLLASATFTDGEKASKLRTVRIVARTSPETFTFEVVKKYPHDTKSYTQGLVVHEGFLYEGTGNYGQSRLRKIDLATGNVLLEKPIEEAYFGEGITIFQNKLYQLTYKSTKAFAYNIADFGREAEYTFTPFTGEGWGLSHNDTSLIASDGSSFIYFIHPQTFEIQRRVRVFGEKGELQNINELEFFNGMLYANVYTTSEIVGIDPKTGLILQVYSARGIVDKAETTSGMDVLNGIAINPLNGNFLLTGKYWSRVYEVRPKPTAAD